MEEARSILRLAVLPACLAMLIFGCGGSGGADGPTIRPPDSLWAADMVIPAELQADVQYWSDLNWRAGAIPVNIAGESLSRRRALMYYAVTKGKFIRDSTLVVQTVQCAQGEKLKQMQKLCRNIGFAISDSVYSPYRGSETYYIWIEQSVYDSRGLVWLSDYILTTYPQDFLCVQPMVSDTPFPGGGGWPHSEGGGASF
jgi:hypothetical protein